MTLATYSWGRLCLAILCGALAACAVGPDNLAPSTPAVSTLTSTPLPLVTAGGSTRADRPQGFVDVATSPVAWWTVLRAPPIDSLVTQSLLHNPTIAAAEAALRGAREIVEAQRGALFPAATANYAPTRARISQALASPVSSGASVYTLHSANLSVAYVPDVFGGTRRSIEAAEAQSDSQVWQLRAARLALAANVVTAALQEASLRDQLRATSRLQTIAERQWELLKVQRRLGVTSGALVLSQESLLRQVQTSQAVLERQAAQQHDQLAALVGTVPADLPPLDIQLSNLELPDVPTRLPASLVEHRPDVEVAASQLRAANAGVGIAVANMLPQITLGADYGASAQSLSQLFRASGLLWSLGANLAQPVFDGSALLHRKRAAEAQYEQALAQYQNTVLSAFQNVADSLEACRHDGDVYVAALRAETIAGAALHIATRQQELGDVAALVVLNAEASYQQTRIARIQAQASRYVDVAAAYLAVGGSWDDGIADSIAQVGSPARKQR